MILDLSSNFGPPATVDSGFVTSNDFPDLVKLDLVSIPTAEVYTITALFSSPLFTRGDVNDDGIFSLTDPLLMLNYLFVTGAPTPTCLDALDSNDDGSLSLIDALHMLSAMFISGSPAPSAPHPDCGVDPTADLVGCELFSSCP